MILRKRPLGVIALLALSTALMSGCVTLGRSSQAAVLRTKDKVSPALVHIRPVKEIFSRGRRQEVSIIGSGFIISSDGYVITNEHVAGEATSVRCVLGNKDEVDAEVVGVDPLTDIAVLKLRTDRKLPFVKLGDSDLVEVGQIVLALGSPHGLARSVSMGIISVTGRHLESRGSMVSPFNNWIQTDAAINPGNSGGPLVNLKGEVIGVNARTLIGADNVGFAIPINTAREVMEALIAHGRVNRSRLGLSLQESLAVTEDRGFKGVMIADVDPLSPAAEAGIRPREVLLQLGGVDVNARFEEDLPEVRKRISDLEPGVETVVTVRRGEEILRLKVVAQGTDEKTESQREFEEWGFTARRLTPELVRRAQLSSANGIIVSGTRAGSIARNARLNAGDIILEMDGETVRDLGHFSEFYEQRVKEKRHLVMLWVRNRALTRFVLLKQEGNGDALEISGEQEGN